MRRKIVGVIGGHSCTKENEARALSLGKNLARLTKTLVCGGLSGTMRAVITLTIAIYYDIS